MLRKSHHKKAMSGTMEIVAGMIILLVAIVIILWILKGGFANFVNSLESCTGKTGECLSSCGNQEPIPAGDAACKREYPNGDAICCKRDTNVLAQSGLGQRGEGANKNIIKLILNKNAIPYGDEVELDQETLYKFEIVLDEKNRNLIKEHGDVCSVYIKDIDQTSQPMVLQRSKTVPDTAANPYSDPVSAKDNEYNTLSSLIVPCSEKNPLWTRYFKPSELDAGKRYEFNIVVYDKTVQDAFTTEDKNLNPNLAIPKAGLINDVENHSLPYDRSHWVANYYIRLKVKPIVEISGLRTDWAAEDDISVKGITPYTLQEVRVAVVSSREVIEKNVDKTKSFSEQLYNTCKHAAISTRYTNTLFKITRVDTGTNGLGILGLGRENFQTASYEAQSQKIPVINNAAQIHFDAASFLYGYYGAEAISGATGIDTPSLIGPDAMQYFFVETQNLTDYYLCVEASVSKTAKDQPKKIIAFSTQPLRIDIAPPTLSNDDSYITVNYPKPYKALVEELSKQSGQRMTPYYFQEYPYIEMTKKCYDKSGCKNYDYYFAPTRIPVNIVANNIEDAAVSLLIGEGLNLLYKEILTSNPLKTVCPLADSGKYRANTNNQIRFYDEQGVFCLKVSDGAGNYWLTWKAVYNPYNVVEKALNSIITTPADSGTVSPNIAD